MSPKHSTTSIALRTSSLGDGKLFSARTGTPSTGWQELRLPRFERGLAITRANAYWFTPRIITPESLLDPSEETPFLLLKHGKANHSVILPIPGNHHTVWLETRNGRIGLAWRSEDGFGDEPAIAFTLTGADPANLPSEAIRLLRTRITSFRSRQEKSPACFINHFGWCTWDAFYDKVRAPDVMRGIKALADGGFTPGFVILDDGWQDTQGWSLNSTNCNAKFPQGLAPLIQRARASGVRHFGVWHTLHGYWHGIAQDGPIAKSHRITSIPQNTEAFKGWPENFDPSVRHALHPDDAPGFYRSFYAELAAAGVDFTKVDGQSATPYFATDPSEDFECHNSFQWSAQCASSQQLTSGGIHCMAHSADILWRLRSAPVFRNSDDFYPTRPFEAQARHLVHNAYHAVFIGLFATPDWDMFHSRHPLALFHAAARALSGGPVYVSDKPGNHDFNLLRRLVLPDGSIPRFESPGLPPANRLFDDPLRDGSPLVIANHGGHASSIALFNCRIEPEPSEIKARWSPAELAGLSGKQFIAHDPIFSETITLRRNQSRIDTLPSHGGLRLWTVSPISDGLLAPLGLEGYLAAAATITSAETTTPGQIAVTLKHPGTHLFWCARPPASIHHATRSIPFYFDPATGLLRVKISAQGPFTLHFTFHP